MSHALFFLSFAYRHLGELFCGVALVTEDTECPRYDFERSTRAETYQFAIDELLAIENDLPETTSQGGRLVRGAAQHNLCQLYLALGIELESNGSGGDAQAAYTHAVSYGYQVIDGGVFSLMQNRFGTDRKSKLLNPNH